MILPIFLFLVFSESVFCCLATSSAVDPSTGVSSSTEATEPPSSSSETPVVYCSPDATITYGMAGDAVGAINTEYIGYASTNPDPVTGEVIATMQLSCTADTGKIASMQLNGNIEPPENEIPAQTVSVSVSCSSLDNDKWFYSTVYGGQTYTIETTAVSCLQI